MVDGEKVARLKVSSIKRHTTVHKDLPMMFDVSVRQVTRPLMLLVITAP